LAFNGNTPYVAYTDYANGNKVTVMKFNGTAWETVGNAGFSAGQATYLSLAFYGSTPYVAYDDWANGYKSTVMKFNGTTWVAVGSPGFSNTNAQDLSLTFNGSTPYVAYEDYTSGTDIIVKKFDGTTWVTVGNTSAYANDGLHPSLVFYGSTPYIAYQNSNGKSAVIKFNGAAWELVGSAGFSAGQAFSESLAFGGSTPYVAYMDRANGDKCTVQKFNGTAWVTVGSAGFSAGGAQNPSLAVNDNTPYVAYRDGNNSYKITVMRFNGMAWETVGATSASTDGALYPSLAFNGNTPYVSYTDYANGGKTTLKRFSMCVSNSNSLLVNTSGTYTVEVTKNGCTATATKTITAIPCCTTQNGDFEMSTIIGASPDLDGGSSTAYWTRTTATSFYPQVITPGNGDNYAIRLRGCRRNTDPFSTVSGIQQGFNFIAGHYYTIRYSARRVNGAFPNPNSVPALQFRASNGALVSHRGGTPIGNAKNITSTSWLNYATGFVANSNFNTVSITAHAHSSAYHYVDIDKVCIADNGIPCPYPDISEVVSVNGLQFTVTNPTNTGANYNYTLQNTATAQIISAGSINQVAAGASTTVNIPNLQAATEYQLNVSPSCSTESIPITVTTANPDVTIADNTIAGCANATQADAFGSIVSNVLDVTGRTVATVIPDANTDLGTISIEMHNQNAPIAINNQVYLGRTFNVTSDQVSGLIPNGGGYTLRLYYLDRELPVGVQPQNLGITWWSGGATAECNMGSYANTPAVTSATLPNAQVADGEFGRNNNGFYLQFHANHFTMFGALIENISLPVKLLTFTGRKNDKYHHVQWTTATEQNSAFFVVQHSTNGIDFQDIGRVSAAGNSNTPSSYSFENAYFATGNNYYRLKMVDLDDAFEYSSTVTIRQDLAANGVHLYLNPTTGVLNIETDNPQQTIVIVNELGILVRTLTSVPPQIDLSELPSGVYMIRIGYQQFKIVKI
ncbi:MAG: hypothetical protein RI894_2507, partial [Bacteroidota bacterium]